VIDELAVVDPVTVVFSLWSEPVALLLLVLTLVVVLT
jgi:hypothetical protein